MAPARCSVLTFLYMHALPLGMANDDGPNDRRVTAQYRARGEVLHGELIRLLFPPPFQMAQHSGS